MAKLEPITIEDARILFKNFAGVGGPYNKEGDRNFSVIIPPDSVDALRADGWNIKQLRPREEGDLPAFHLPVTVFFGGPKSRPPKIVMITSRGRTDLDENTAMVLDWARIKHVDLIVRPYEWNINGRSGVTAYLRTIFVTIEEDYLEQKYADVPEANQPLALEAPMWEGQVVD